MICGEIFIDDTLIIIGWINTLELNVWNGGILMSQRAINFFQLVLHLCTPI